MIPLILCLLTLIASGYSSGEFRVLNSPESIKFKGDEKLDGSLLKEVYSAALGMTIEKSSCWNGMYVHDPFNYPLGLVHVSVEGVSALGDTKPVGQGPTFPLRTDEDELTTWLSLRRRVLDRRPEGNNTLVRVELANGFAALDEYPWIGSSDLKVNLPASKGGALQLDIDEDRKFIEEIALLNAVSDIIKRRRNNVDDFNQDIFWFVFSSLHAISDLHGPDSAATVEAQKILAECLKKLTKDIQEAYKNNVLVTAVLSDVSHTRRSRSIKSDDRAYVGNFTEWNQAADYDEDYPVIFNIILWFGVAFFFSLLAVSVAISTMDPGRDSIIYRMTSNRMKKDN